MKFAILAASALVAAMACGSGAPTSAVIKSPKPDDITHRYVILIHDYWIQYKTAEGDLDHIDGTSTAPFGDKDAARVCFGLASPADHQNVNLVDPRSCAEVSAAILAVHEKFLNDLNATLAPTRFAAEDQAFKAHLPTAIADVRAMISASATGDKQLVLDATASYVGAMIPIITDALNSVDPSVIHN